MFAGIDIGGTYIKVGIMNDDCTSLIDSTQFDFVKEKGIQGVIEGVDEAIHHLCDKNSIHYEDLKGIGVSVPGSISRDQSTVLNAFNLGFHNLPIKKEFENHFKGIPISIGNDADVATLAELHQGIFQGKKTAILITIGTGIGGGIILNGQLFNGGNKNGVELGHFIFDRSGEKCNCGNTGCVETVCSASWLIKQGQTVIEENIDSLICEKANHDISNVSAKIVMDSAKEGDKYALDIFNQYIDNLSSAIISYITILDPEVIGIGGGVSESGEFLFKPLRKKVKEKNFFKFDYPILKAAHGNEAGMIGAAMLVKDTINNRSNTCA